MGNENIENFCELCRQSVQDEVKYGKFMTKGKISVHYYCLLLSSNLIQNGEENEGFLGFLPNDIVREAKRVKSQICYYCHERYANVACCAPKCRRTFHLSCGIENGVMSHFTDTYQSFCPRDVKWNKSERPSVDEICLICYEKLGKFNKYFMILSPCCKTGWFHRWCLASFALSAGYFFKCPKCNDSTKFREQVVRRGIFIPDQDAAWELENNAFAELLERPSECIMDNCCCPNGRAFNEAPYKLLMCQTCGSKAIHKQCMAKNSSTIFTCNDCSDILKKRNIDVEQIFEKSMNSSDDENDNGEEDNRIDIDLKEDEKGEEQDEEKDINIMDNTSDENDDDEIDSNEECKKNSKVMEENNDDCSKIIQNGKTRKRLRIDSDDDDDSDQDELENDDINLSKEIEGNNENCSISNNNNQCTLILEKKEHNNNRSPSCSSLESINNVLRGRQKKKKCTRRLSESSSISTSSSDIPLSRCLLRKVLTSNEQRDHNEINTVSKMTDKLSTIERSTSTSSSSSSSSTSFPKATSMEDKNSRKFKKTSVSKDHETNEKKKKIVTRRCSSLGYASDNTPPNSSSDQRNLKKRDSHYNSEKENEKQIKIIDHRHRCKRSIINENYDDLDFNKTQTSDDLSNSLDSGRTLRKRKKTKIIPYQLRERSDSISYEDLPEDENLSFTNLKDDWAAIFCKSRKSDSKCNNTTTTLQSKKRTQTVKGRYSESDVMPSGQTSIDTFFKRCTPTTSV